MSEIEQLIANAAAGDMDAFEEIYRQTYRQVYFTCLAFLKNEQDAADVTQDVYIIVMRSISELKDRSRFENWLGRITVNKCKDFLKAKRPVPMDEETITELVQDEGELLLPEDYVTNEAKRRIVHEIMKEELSDILYQTVILFYFQNMSATEIAELMECPVGTVTSRLCIARTKIKQGVERYEKKSGDKLYSVTLVPVLAAILMAESRVVRPAGTFSGTMAMASQNMTTRQVAKTGGKVMLKTLKGKIIAAVAALAVTGVAVATAVALLTGSKDEGNGKKSEGITKSQDMSIETGEITKTTEQTFENNESETTDDSKNNISAETDYTAMAEEIVNQVDKFFIALTTGDVDTVAAMSDENQDTYEDFMEICQYDCTSQFLKTLYGNIKYCINEETIEDLAYNLERAYANGDSTVIIDLAYSTPSIFLLETLYPAAFEDGAVIGDNSDVTSNEEAFEILEKAMSVMPMKKASALWVTLPDENGNVNVCIDYFIEKLDLDDLSIIDDRYPQRFVWENINYSENIVVGATGDGFKENNDILVEIDRLLTEKDFVGLEAYLSELTGEDYHTQYTEDYGSYDELTDTQKEFVDNFVAEKMVYQLIDYVYDKEESGKDGKSYRVGTFLLTMPILDDHDNRDIMLTDWYSENSCVDYSIDYSTTTDFEKFTGFLYYYYQVIAYAAEYVE